MKTLSPNIMATEQLEDFSLLKKSLCGEHYYDENRTSHREDGPAVFFPKSWNGTDESYWYNHGTLHRVGGPAVDNRNAREWIQNGKHHRDDGPAITHKNGQPGEYWLSGLRTTKEVVMGKNGKIPF
jgi:hypothetical protein